MSGEQVQFLVDSLTEEEVDVDAFLADARRLATERGLSKDDIDIKVGQTFPIDGAILILLGFASKVVYGGWKEFILPELKERYRIKKQEAGS